MSGHSHWAGIKHKKGVVDVRRGKVFSKLARQVIVAARAGGGDPAMNLSLRYAIDRARAANMPKDTIEKAVLKGMGELDGQTFEEVVYEGYGPGGVALLVEGLTDNRNRTSSDLRRVFDVRNGRLGETNCVAWLFETKGVVRIPREGTEEEPVLEVALESGAEDVQEDDEDFLVICEPRDLEAVRAALDAGRFAVASADITRLAKTVVDVERRDAEKLLRLVSELEDLDDVQRVYMNGSIPPGMEE